MIDAALQSVGRRLGASKRKREREERWLSDYVGKLLQENQ